MYFRDSPEYLWKKWKLNWRSRKNRSKQNWKRSYRRGRASEQYGQLTAPRRRSNRRAQIERLPGNIQGRTARRSNSSVVLPPPSIVIACLNFRDAVASGAFSNVCRTANAGLSYGCRNERTRKLIRLQPGGGDAHRAEWQRYFPSLPLEEKFRVSVCNGRQAVWAGY